MNIRPCLLALCTAGAAALGASSAVAQTLGQVAPAGAAGMICPASCEVAQVATGAGTPSYVVPSGGGVITSWTFRALKAGTAYLTLYEYTNGNFGVVSDTAARKFAPSELETTPTRNPVYGGEHLGVVTNGPPPAFRTADAGDIAQLLGPPIVVPGGPPPMQPAPGAPPSGALVDMQVTLEPDADHDGYGDLTQDLCPTDPKRQDACPKPPPSDGGGGGQTGGTGVSSSSPAIAGTPRITLSASKRESVRHGFVTLTLLSDSDVTASATGQVKQRSVHRPYMLRATGESLRAHSPAVLRIKLTRKEKKSILRRLWKHRRAVATLTVTVRDAAGATSTASLSIRLTAAGGGRA